MPLVCCTQHVRKFGKLSSGHRNRQSQFSFQSKRRTMPKNIQTVVQLCLFHIQHVNAQNPSSQDSAVCEPRTSKCTSWVQKRQKNQRSNCQHSLDHGESKDIPEKKKKSTSASLIMLNDCVDHNKLWKILRIWNTRVSYLSPEKSAFRSRLKSQNLTWNN